MSLLRCWIVYAPDGTVRGVYPKRRRAALHGTPVEAELVPAELWDAALGFLVRWFAYRDAGILGPMDAVSWRDVLDAEATARFAVARYDVGTTPIATTVPEAQILASVASTPNSAATAQLERELSAAKVTITQLQRTHDRLREELKELNMQRNERKTSAVLDVTRTLGYMQAASSAPNDPVQAYRAGMVYAAQLFAKLGTR